MKVELGGPLGGQLGRLKKLGLGRLFRWGFAPKVGSKVVRFFLRGCLFQNSLFRFFVSSSALF